MSDVQLSILQSEWITLQTQFDSYEKCSLAIKMLSVLLSCSLIFAADAGIWTLFIVAILWLQDGIWKTFQNRMGQRLEIIEQAIQDNLMATQDQNTKIGMQFNLAWSQKRQGVIGLLGEYVKQSLKPTVVYPHGVLIVWVIVYLYVS